MANVAVNNDVCRDCKSLGIVHSYSLININGLKVNSRYLVRNVIRNDDKMATPLPSITKKEAWKENSSSSNSIEKHKEQTAACSSEKSYISHIPNELLLYIFSFLDIYDLCSCVASVCTKWWKLSKDPSFWKHLRFSFEHPVEGERIQEILTLSPHLVTLELQSREDGGELLTHAAACCHRLEKLTAKFCDGLTEDTFRSLVENCPRLYYLNVEGSRVCSSDCYHTMAKFHGLTYLNLSHCHFLDNIGLVKIAKQCKYLEYVDIDGITGIHDSAVTCLTKEVGHGLTYLYLDGENLTDVAYRSLSTCTKLKKLGISFCEQMTDLGLSGVYNLTQLTFLKLRKGIQLTPIGLETLFGEGRLSLLTHINLGECSLMDDRVLIAMASSCPQLTNLVLHWCWEVTDEGISAIVNKCCHVRVLDLVGVVQLTGESFRNISTQLPHLVILDLEQCNNIIDPILQKIVTEAKNPLLRVFDYWGDPVLPQEGSDVEEESGDSDSSNF